MTSTACPTQCSPTAASSPTHNQQHQGFPTFTADAAWPWPAAPSASANMSGSGPTSGAQEFDTALTGHDLAVALEVALGRGSEVAPPYQAATVSEEGVITRPALP